MKKEIYIKPITGILCVALGFILCLLFWRPWEQPIITTGPTANEIIKHTVEPAKAIDTAIKTKVKETAGMDSRANNLAKKLAQSQAENKDLTAKIGELKNQPSHEVTDNTAKQLGDEYANDLTHSSINSDSICNQLIAVKDSIIANKDTLIDFATVKAQIFEHGFNEMSGLNKQQAEAIKQLNKKFKWQKIQATGLKVVAIAAAAMIIKNNVKF
jgi:hypothetical protein